MNSCVRRRLKGGAVMKIWRWGIYGVLRWWGWRCGMGCVWRFKEFGEKVGWGLDEEVKMGWYLWCMMMKMMVGCDDYRWVGCDDYVVLRWRWVECDDDVGKVDWVGWWGDGDGDDDDSGGWWW